MYCRVSEEGISVGYPSSLSIVYFSVFSCVFPEDSVAKSVEIHCWLCLCLQPPGGDIASILCYSVQPSMSLLFLQYFTTIGLPSSACFPCDSFRFSGYDAEDGL